MLSIITKFLSSVWSVNLSFKRQQDSKLVYTGITCHRNSLHDFYGFRKLSLAFISYLFCWEAYDLHTRIWTRTYSSNTIFYYNITSLSTSNQFNYCISKLIVLNTKKYFFAYTRHKIPVSWGRDRHGPSAGCDCRPYYSRWLVMQH